MEFPLTHFGYYYGCLYNASFIFYVPVFQSFTMCVHQKRSTTTFQDCDVLFYVMRVCVGLEACTVHVLQHNFFYHETWVEGMGGEETGGEGVGGGDGFGALVVASFHGRTVLFLTSHFLYPSTSHRRRPLQGGQPGGLKKEKKMQRICCCL